MKLILLGQDFFDLIHVRNLAQCISSWEHVLHEMFR